MTKKKKHTKVDETNLRLKFMPISFFAISLGLTGFTLAAQKIGKTMDLPFQLSVTLLIGTLIISGLISFFYILKFLFYRNNVLDEFRNPVKINFFPILAKILLILSIIFLELSTTASHYLWIAGTSLQLLFSLVIISIWFNHTKFEIKHLNPAWFIPIVGNLIVPIAGFHHGYVEISWFFFSVGLIFWIALFTIILYRLFFHPPIAERLIPTLFILFAPPAIGFISWYKLTSSFDAFGKILYYFSLFMFILIFTQIKNFFKIKFYLSWWAYTFPIAAISIATNLVFQITGNTIFKYISFGQIVFLLILIIFLLIKTIIEIRKRKICLEEE